MKNVIKRILLLALLFFLHFSTVSGQNLGVSGAFNPSTVENCETSDLTIFFTNEDFVNTVSNGDARITVTFPLTGEYTTPVSPPTESTPGTFSWSNVGNVWEGMLIGDVGPLSSIEIVFEVTAASITSGTSSNLNVELLTGVDPNLVNNIANPSLEIIPSSAIALLACPPVDQGVFPCIDDVPAPALSIPEFEAQFGDMILNSGVCGGISISYEDDTTNTNTGCAMDPVVLTRSYIFESVNSSDTCEVEYTLIDDVAPILICQDITVGLDENGNVDIDPNLMVASFTNNCTGLEEENVTFSLSNSIFDCDDLDPNEINCGSTFMVTLFAEDACGNVSSCDANVTIMDDLPPMLNCPPNTTIALDGGECAAIYIFDIPTAVDNCDNSTLFSEESSVMQTGGTTLTSGDEFEPGFYSWTYQSTDDCGNVAICEFSLEVVEVPEDEVLTTLACNNLVNISMGYDCAFEIGADMLLEGGPYRCYEDYIIEIEGIGGAIITETGTYIVKITDPITGNNCWSTVLVEDKLPPQIDCEEPLCELESLRGIIGEGDELFIPDPMCWDFGNGTPQDEVYYDRIEFEVAVGGDYTFIMTDDGDVNGIGALYEGVFDVQMQCANLITGEDDYNGIAASEPVFTATLNPGTYTLVSTLWNTDVQQAYEWTYSGPELVSSECVYSCFEYYEVLNSEGDIPEPSYFDCSEASIDYVDSFEGDDCSGRTLTRTYVVTDINGYSSSCTYSFEFLPADIDIDVILPASEVELGCNMSIDPADISNHFDNPQTLDNPSTFIEENNEGYAYGYLSYEQNGHLQKIDNNVCNIYTTYSDNEIELCGEDCPGNRKVIRTWSIVDWCNIQLINYVQTIKSVDQEAPTLTTQDLTFTTGNVECETSFSVPHPINLHDNCDSNPKYDIVGPAGITIVGSYSTGFDVLNAPHGIHTFYYRAYDCCDNQENYPFTVSILDNTPPIVVAKQDIVVSLSGGSGSDGYALLYTNSVDNGSHDGCSTELRYELRRDQDVCGVSGNTTYNADGHPEDGSSNAQSSNYDSDDGRFVRFCCEDIDNATIDVDGDGINDAGYVKVWFRVWDDGDFDGEFGSSGDNYNEAWVHVKVEDKSDPTIICPPDITISCDSDYFDTSLTGEAEAYSTCGDREVEYTDIYNDLNSCQQGSIRRRWSVVGNSSIFCDQSIVVHNLYVTTPTISFAQVGDFTAVGCPGDIEYGEPTWNDDPCESITYTVETDTFKFEDGACYKLRREYTVINWCDYHPNDPQWVETSDFSDGLATHVQIVKVTDTTRPEIQNCSDVQIAVNDNNDEDGDGNLCEATFSLSNIAFDEGSTYCPTGWLKWQVSVDLWGDGTYDYEFSSYLPANDQTFNDTNGNGIPDKYLSPTQNGEEVSVTLENIEGPMSNHKVRWSVSDGCNNSDACEYTFTVVDEKPPTPYCININTALMEPSGTVDIWAIDFNLGSFDNCTSPEDLRYTFSQVPPENDSNFDESKRSSSMAFDCDDVEQSPVELAMFVWDEAGNSDHCVVYLSILDNTSACGEGMRISGEITSESGIPFSNVPVSLNADLPEYPRTISTNELGEYAFTNSTLHANFEVWANSETDYLNGVSTLDLVKIQRHILGIEALPSACKVIAADVNNDYKVTASDLLELRKLILGVIEKLPNNDSWRFVDASQDLALPLVLSEVKYSIDINNLQSDSEGNDFTAVKVGDVSDNAEMSNAAGPNTTVARSIDVFELSYSDVFVEKGSQVILEIKSGHVGKIAGIQLGLVLEGLEVESIIGAEGSNLNGHYHIQENKDLLVSYPMVDPLNLANGDVVLTIQLLSTENGRLSDMIAVSPSTMNSEVYEIDAEEKIQVKQLLLNDNSDEDSNILNTLYQNKPNPFKDNTLISFDLENPGQVELKITDLTGNLIKQYLINGKKGENSVTIHANEIQARGVLMYKIESQDFFDAKKMIIIE